MVDAGFGAQVRDSTTRVTAVLRAALLAPLAVLAVIVHEGQGEGARYLAVFAVFAAWAAFGLWWSFTRPAPDWAGPVSIFVDLALLVTMALVSAGATSYITPVFYLYPVFTVFFYRPLITGLVGLLVAGGYALVWLDNLAIRGGPGDPDIVWMHFLLLAWMALSTTGLSLVLAHRAREDARARATHDSLSAQLLAADHRASTRVADDLHDGALQDVIAVRRMLESLADDAAQPERVAEAARVLANTTAALRGTVAHLHPQVLRQLGLEAALRELAREASAVGAVDVHADIGPLPALGEEREFAVFAAVRELLSNARRHAEAARIVISAAVVDGSLTITVADDGIGIAPDGPSPDELVRAGHIGLASHALRVESLGGSLAHRPRRPAGTVGSVVVPVAGWTDAAAGGAASAISEGRGR